MTLILPTYIYDLSTRFTNHIMIPSSWLELRNTNSFNPFSRLCICNHILRIWRISLMWIFYVLIIILHSSRELLHPRYKKLLYCIVWNPRLNYFSFIFVSLFSFPNILRETNIEIRFLKIILLIINGKVTLMPLD